MSGKLSAVVRRELYLLRLKLHGAEAPRVRASFGRMIGARGGVLSATGSGMEALVANFRELGQDGYSNRSWRRHRPL